MKWTPHPYQYDSVKFLLQQACAALFLDPGLGKTSITLGAIKVLKAQGLLRRALIIAPLRVCYAVWPNEVKKWDDFSHLKVAVLHGRDKEALLYGDYDIFVINPEGLEWLFAENRFQVLGADTLVIDESSKFKHTNTRRFKLLKPHLSKFKRRYILTGTPAPNGLMDLFGQVYIMDQGKALGRYITSFRQRFFDPCGFGGYDWKPKPGAADDIYELLRPYVRRLAASDYLQLPELVVNNIVVDLPPDVMEFYDKMHDEMIAALPTGEEITALSAAAASTKCRQIANGGIFLQLDERPALESQRWRNLHTAKIDAVQSLVEELNGQPVLVAYDFKHDLDRLRKAFPKATYVADYAGSKFVEIEAAWNRGEIDMLVGHPASMGHGLNLQGAGQHVIWHSLTWDLELYDQFIKRLLRQGNEHSHVFVHHILGRNTIDFMLVKALRRKDGDQQSLLSAFNEYVRDRAACEESFCNSTLA